MEQTNLNTRPINTLSASEATLRLTQVVKQAYFRRSRQLPANLSDIVETIKADILRVMPLVTINQIDEAVTEWVLNQIDKPISPAFFFAAPSLCLFWRRVYLDLPLVFLNGLFF